MAAPLSPQDARALDRDERALDDRARQPQLAQLTDRELTDLIAQLRNRRDRARGLADRQRRAARDGAADAGNREKHRVLSNALRRASDERRKRDEGPSQKDLAKKALKLKRQSDSAPARPTGQTANEGIERIENRDEPVTGAFAHVGERPARERSGPRGVRSGKTS